MIPAPLPGVISHQVDMVALLSWMPEVGLSVSSAPTGPYVLSPKRIEHKPAEPAEAKREGAKGAKRRGKAPPQQRGAGGAGIVRAVVD